MRLVTLFVPGLAARHVDSGALISLREHPPQQRASLVPSFPPLRACVRASVAAGAPSSHHGIRFESDGPVPPGLDLLRHACDQSGLALDSATIEAASDLDAAADGAAGVLRLEYAGLVEALAGDRPGSRAEQEALVALDAVVGGILRRAPAKILVHGSAALLPVTARLDADDILGAPGLRVRAEEGVAWIEDEAEGDGPQLEWRDRVLAQDGIARILGGRALELHQAPSDRGWAVTCEPGWSFGPARNRATAVDAADRKAPVVLGWGSESTVWPPAVHDHRLGPTLARAVGGAVEKPFDRPLPF